MIDIRRLAMLSFLILITGAISVRAQNDANASGDSTTTLANSIGAIPRDSIPGDQPYTLNNGDNEFGFWGGGAFAATSAFGGLTDAEASDRKFLIAAFRYGRTLVANDSIALQYTLDAVPLAVATGNIVEATTVRSVTTFRRETAYGGGLTPLGLQLDFSNGARVHPFIHVNAGGLIFNKSVPLPDAGQFAFVLEGGGGVRIFTSDRRAVTLGLRLHHISNGDRSGSNRGLNQFIIYAGFSVFK